MSNQTEPSPDVKRIDECLAHLGEHFDSVMIFATRNESGESDGTIRVQKGVGNWYARYGQVRQWIVRVDEDERDNARRGE